MGDRHDEHEEQEGAEMKGSLRSRQEPRRVSNGVIIAAMLISLCVLSIVKARYCSTPFGPGTPYSSRLSFGCSCCLSVLERAS